MTLTVRQQLQSLENIAGDGLTDAPKGSASCGAQHDVRGSELLAIFLALDWGLGGVGCDQETGSWHTTLATSGLKQLRGEYKTRMEILTRMFCALSSTRWVTG